jgi:ribosomal protein L12E/L44/L45/RPP1/RPP2
MVNVDEVTTNIFIQSLSTHDVDGVMDNQNHSLVELHDEGC